MSRGKRYNGEAKLNMKKVLAVLVALLVIVMFVFVIYKLVTNGKGERMTNNYYFTSFQDNKYGVINNKGEEVIAPSYQEYIVIPNNKTDIFLCTYDVDYTNNTYKTKALNSKNKEIFTEYENIEPIANFDANNTISYEQNAIKVQKDGKYGMINIEGKEILPCEYDDLYSLKNTDNSILIEKDAIVFYFQFFVSYSEYCLILLMFIKIVLLASKFAIGSMFSYSVNISLFFEFKAFVLYVLFV